MVHRESSPDRTRSMWRARVITGISVFPQRSDPIAGARSTGARHVEHRFCDHHVSGLDRAPPVENAPVEDHRL